MLYNIVSDTWRIGQHPKRQLAKNINQSFYIYVDFYVIRLLRGLSKAPRTFPERNNPECKNPECKNPKLDHKFA
jgi:hypothetical protein